MFNVEEQLFLLSVIEEDGDIMPLAQVHSYDEILAEIKGMIEKGWVVSDDKLKLTNEGHNAIQNLLSVQKKLKRDWIRPYFQFRRDKIDENYIYLPKK
jgi:hypothetical protein